MKKIFFIITGILVLGFGVYFLLTRNSQTATQTFSVQKNGAVTGSVSTTGVANNANVQSTQGGYSQTATPKASSTTKTS